jgi:hypothetical protein
VGAGGVGQLSWTPAKTLKAGADYTIRVTSHDSSLVTDASDGAFSIS